MLVDGTYRLSISGSVLGIDANGTAVGTDSVDDFFRLFGDADGDGDVDNQDYDAFIECFADGENSVLFDFDAKPNNEQRDKVAFLKRFGTELF